MILPPFKWPGSKSWLHWLASSTLESGYRRIVEPFAGAAAFTLASSVDKSLLVDNNQNVITSLQQIRDNHEEILKLLRPLENTKINFDLLKKFSPCEPAHIAARLIFLSNTAWGGMYRENKQGKFNVPFGDNGRPCFYEDRIRHASTRLKGAEIVCASFKDAIAATDVFDLLFVDPPYTCQSSEVHFERYSKVRYSWRDQIELALDLNYRGSKGSSIIIAGPSDENWRKLYPTWLFFEARRKNALTAKSGITSVRVELLAFSKAAYQSLGITAQHGLERREVQ